ncbi:DUF4023 family protein [Mesobacillus subterraneus]|nr:DUF4023 family protein [Mesobacillus subterraneus]MCM3575072.1 DUF4023 family protein [Mesobacillus subterraneus]
MENTHEFVQKLHDKQKKDEQILHSSSF